MPLDFSVIAVDGATRPPTLNRFSENDSTVKKSEFSEKPPPVKENVESKLDVERLQESLAAHDISLKFSQDKETETLVVQLIDQKTGAAIQQLPSEVSLKIAAELGKLQGLIFNYQV